MSVWHGTLYKKKPSGGKVRPYRKKRKFEKGSFPAETLMGERKLKKARGRGGTLKNKILSDKYACVTNTKTGKTEKAEIVRVVRNPANVDYNRRGVITKGAIIETSAGIARVTSRPGQHGVLNAVLVEEKKKS
ncbi:MAG: 30S ribosomal protein S8e [Candidatus Bathyarchaeia archaeon]